jgi:hypothetical protein
MARTKKQLKAQARAKTARDTGPFEAAMVEAGRQTKAMLGAVGIGKGVNPKDKGALNKLREQRPLSTFAGSMLPTAAIPGGIVGRGIAARLGVAGGKTAASRASPEKFNLGKALKRGSDARKAAHRETAAAARKRVGAKRPTPEQMAAILKEARKMRRVKPKVQKVKQASLGAHVGDAFGKSGGVEMLQRGTFVEARLAKDRKKKRKKLAAKAAKTRSAAVDKTFAATGRLHDVAKINRRSTGTIKRK